ncbi:uncharacterized protein CDV56_104310 [Aspergillus thermomutatus]|uniref:Rhodopsin domain-containing protein n=1 Tax=Aspergillus thermomutatus TaxID=41047 RepID=A0A397HEU4_ASPTH|nr:uncharacterized protein CDV56_104310 [Aspergillus thermomutatus]RHZ58930.1 hypothetical protein CDV56_104310 [Aspergillus thermomutatus]
MASTEIVPAMPPPAGMTSNFIDPVSCGAKFLIVNCVFVPLAAIALLVRTWTRLFVVRSFQMDDYLMIMALVGPSFSHAAVRDFRLTRSRQALSAVLTGVTLTMLNYGLGNHMWDTPLSNFSPHFLKLNVIAAIIYCAATGFTKVSVLVFYLRIFPTRGFHLAVWTIAFIAVGYNVASVLANIFSCSPIAKSWDVSITGGSCMNRPVFYFANAGLGIFTDFATVLVPIPWLRRLQMPARQKVAVGLILGMGCFVGIVSCIRLASLYTLLKSTDLTWATTNALMWCTIELNLGILGGCITAMRPFVRRYFPRLLGLSSSSGRNNYNHGSSRKHGHPLASIPRSDNPKFTNEPSTQYLATLKGGADNSSEEHILSESPLDGGIIRTVEFNVDNSSTRKA